MSPSRFDQELNPTTSMFRSRISDNSTQIYQQSLNILFINTHLLIDHIVSLHLYFAVRQDLGPDILKLLSQFQLELRTQSHELHQQLNAFGKTPVESQGWIFEANMWRKPTFSNGPKSLSQLWEATDFLAGLYEQVLPAAFSQPDHGASYYLLAQHLIVLIQYGFSLEHAIGSINSQQTVQK
ncbi:MAG: hypothetical protein R3A50_14385 [Saprospiraceae bacterium]